MPYLNTFLIGADPEFTVLQADKLIMAGNFIVDPLSQIGIGYDHSDRVLELRPTPAKSAYTLIRRMRAMLTHKFLAPITKYTWKAGAVGCRPPSVNSILTLGGHVHLDLPTYRTVFDEAYGYNREEIDPLFTTRLKAMDRFTETLEQLDILPSTECKERRARGGYGRPGDWRETPGSKDPKRKVHFEYRTQPSWLYSPAAAFIAITGTKFAAIDPEGVLALKPTAASLSQLTEFFSRYKAKDGDADRAVEKILSRPKTVDLQADPTVNIQPVWEEPLLF